MFLTLAGLTTLTLLAAAAGADDPSSDLLDRIRRHMAENLARLPNYTCRETVERTAADTGSRHFVLIDRLRLEVAYVGGKELYAWPGAEQFQDRSLADMVGTGAIATGAFATLARGIFTTTAPVFRWNGEQPHDGRNVVRFDFHVALEKSHFQVQTGAEPVTVAYDGFLEADRDTLEPMRLEVQTDALPPVLKLRHTSESIEYATTHLGESDFLLPVTSELSMVQTTGREERNRTHFETCRQYAGESTVHFDLDDAPASAGPAAAPITLPPKVRLSASLRDAIDQAQAARGDQIFATVTSDLRRAGAVVVPKGAVLTGRITRVTILHRGTITYFVVGLRFRTIEFGGRRGPLSGGVEAAGVGADYWADYDSKTGESLIWLKTHILRLAAGTRMVIETW